MRQVCIIRGDCKPGCGSEFRHLRFGAVFGAVLAGGLAHLAAELAGEVAVIVETTVQRDGGERAVAAGQQLTGGDEAHADEIGFMVKHITAEGFVHVDRIGGSDYATARGRKRATCSAVSLRPVSRMNVPTGPGASAPARRNRPHRGTTLAASLARELESRGAVLCVGQHHNLAGEAWALGRDDFDIAVF